MIVAVLGGEEVAVAVRKEVVRAEEQAAAQAEAATQANSEVLPATKSNQAPQRQQKVANADATAEVAQGAGVAAPQDEKLAQAVGYIRPQWLPGACGLQSLRSYLS